MAITISGENNNDRIIAQDGVIDTISGFNISGIITASSFTGDLTGDVTGNITGNVTGNINNSTLLLQVGGTEKLRLNSDRVIIGQTLSNNQPTYNTSTTFVTTHTNNSGAWNAIAIISGNSTGASFLKFGDKDDEDVSQIGHYNVDNSLRFYTNGGNERLRITSGGFVGINSAIPQAKLDVSANSSGDAGIIHITQAGTGDATIDFQLKGIREYSLGIDNSDSDKFKLSGTAGLGSNDLLTVTNAGLVGIGTDNALARLDVYKGTSATDVDIFSVRSKTGAFNIQCSDTDAANPEWRLRTYYNEDLVFSPGGTGSSGEKVRITSAGLFGIGVTPISIFHVRPLDETNFLVRNEGSTVVLASETNNGRDNNRAMALEASHFEFIEGGSEKVRITSAGFVQIGAAADVAEAPLHVTAENSNGINAIFGAKDFVTHANYNYADANIALQGRDADDNDTGAGIQFTVRNTNNTNWLHGAITMDQSCNYIFKNGGAGTTVGSEKVRITSGGSVGINTTSPSRKLVVVDNLGGGIGVIGSNAGIYMGEHHTGGFQNNCAIARAAANNYHISGSTPGDLCIAGESTKALIFGTSVNAGAMAERLRITSDGTTLFNATSVNAGGASPNLAIDVGDSNLHGVIIQAGGGENGGDLAGLAFGHGATGTIARPKAAIALNASGSYGRGDLCFYVDGASDNNAVAAGDERMRIKSNGQVIISNSNPPASGPMMHVTDDGSATTLGTTSTFRVSNDGGSASYSVFEAQSGSGSIRLANNGDFWVTGYIKSSNQIFINNSAPTIYLQDTDHHSAMIHQNSGLFYVLRGAGNNSTNWVQYNSQWPLYIRMDNNNAYFGGSVYSSNTLLTGSSDLRLKKNLVKIQTPLEKISKLSGYNFDWNDNVTELGFTPDIPTNDVGLIAQDVQEVAPQAVQHAPFDQVYDKETKLQKSKSGEKYLTVQYEKLVPLLVEAIKELKAEVDALKSS